MEQINSLDLPKFVGVIHSEVKREYFPTEEQYVTEKGAEKVALVVISYLEKLGVKAKTYPGDDTLVERLKKDKPDMVFNLVDSIRGNEYLSSTIPGILDMLEIPYTGAGILGLALTYNKFLTKSLLQQAGVPVPNYQLFLTSSDQLDINLRFPLISKLNEIHGAVEINKDSISEDEKHLRERLKFLISTYDQPVLVEEFIVGREVVVMVLEGLHKKVYLGEKIFNKPNDKYVFATFEDQWLDTPEAVESYTYAKYEDEVLKNYGKKAFGITRMMDYGKFDVRIDSSGRYFFIDVNANPAFGPRELSTSMGYIIEEIYDVPFPEILRRLMVNTMRGPTDDTAVSQII
jgi:D-alanine-D-alanine ligase-like ATP-grasp enzyme